jgi:hypothetical protein
MSKPENGEPENFLTRWSSRKLASRTQSARQDSHSEHDSRDQNGAIDKGAVDETHKAGAGNQPFDPAQLPSLDSIGADTNIADFLRREVPPDLTRAALRRAWTSDPAIKNFVGLVENGWDFNDPSGMPGFGPINAEEVARLAGKIIEALPETAPKDQTKEVSRSEKDSEVTCAKALPAGPDTPRVQEPGIGHDAAQQNENDKRS